MQNIAVISIQMINLETGCCSAILEMAEAIFCAAQEVRGSFNTDGPARVSITTRVTQDSRRVKSWGPSTSTTAMRSTVRLKDSPWTGILDASHAQAPTRIYRLAADTAEEVEKWTHCLLVTLTQNNGSNKGK